MLKIKLIILCLPFFFFHNAIAQDKEVSSVNSLFEVFSKLSDNIDKLIDKQEGKRLYRHLEYFRKDLNKYLVIRKEITTYLETKNYSSFDTLRVQEAVLNLQLQIVKLGKRLETIKVYADQTLLNGADDYLDDIENVTQGQRVKYLNKLEGLSNGEQVNKVQLKNDGAVIYKRLQKSISLIDKIRIQLKTKFNL